MAPIVSSCGLSRFLGAWGPQYLGRTWIRTLRKVGEMIRSQAPEPENEPRDQGEALIGARLQLRLRRAAGLIVHARRHAGPEMSWTRVVTASGRLRETG